MTSLRRWQYRRKRDRPAPGAFRPSSGSVGRRGKCHLFPLCMISSGQEEKLNGGPEPWALVVFCSRAGELSFFASRLLNGSHASVLLVRLYS